MRADGACVCECACACTCTFRFGFGLILVMVVAMALVVVTVAAESVANGYRRCTEKSNGKRCADLSVLLAFL